jgi:hypothetical protein
MGSLNTFFWKIGALPTEIIKTKNHRTFECNFLNKIGGLSA